MSTDLYKLEKLNDITIITLSLNNVMHEENETLMQSFDQLFKEGHKKIILDLSNTAYISSLILASFVYIQKKSKELGGNLVFCQVKNRVAEVLKMTNLDKVFEISTTKEEAIKKFTKG